MNKFETMCPELRKERNSFGIVGCVYNKLRFYFENGFDTEMSYIESNYIDWFDFNNHNKTFNLKCHHCNETHRLDELTYKNQKLICKCGAEHTSNDIIIKGAYYSSDHYFNMTKHNLKNDTFAKVSVPTIISEKWFYCNDCRTTQKLEDMELVDKKRVCECGKSYSFDECKLINACYNFYTSGNIYFDDHKITISYMKYHSDVTANDIYYWQDGSQRLTMNLDTGYSYITNTGFEYTAFNKVYRTRNGKNAPKMFNASYSNVNMTLETFCYAKYETLLKKYKDNENLINYLLKNKSKVINNIFKHWFEKIDNYMTNHFNSTRSYKIKSLTEKYKDFRKNEDIKPYESYLLTLHNRFINASLKDLMTEIPAIIDSIKHNEKRNYKTLSRESNNILLDHICKSINASKKLRKRISSDLNLMDHYRLIYCNLMQAFVNIAKNFKIKENVNKVYNLFSNELLNDRRRYYHSFYAINDDMMKLWLSYRNEHYISNCSLKELEEKIGSMSDSLRLIRQIIDVYGSDWDLNSVKFYNEKQFHDELCRITNAEEFVELLNKKKDAQALEPFEMEDEIYELEETDNDIYVARNQAILTNIGQSLGICVGGYGGKVKFGACRIVYLKENGIYKACLELLKKKQNKEIVYTLVQAKLMHNNLVKSNAEMNQKILDWANKYNIKIETHDMNKDTSDVIEVQNYEYDELEF